MAYQSHGQAPVVMLKKKKFNHDVLVQVMWLADRHSDQELYTSAKHCAKIHLAQLHLTEEFLNLPLCLLLDIIKGSTASCSATIHNVNIEVH